LKTTGKIQRYDINFSKSNGNVMIALMIFSLPLR